MIAISVVPKSQKQSFWLFGLIAWILPCHYNNGAFIITDEEFYYGYQRRTKRCVGKRGFL